MRLRLICVGQKMPDWVSAGYNDYARRMPPELPLELTEIPMAHRGKNPDIPRLMQRESDAILTAVGPRDRVIALEVGGRPWSDRKSTRLNSSHVRISYAVFCLKKKITTLVTALAR